MLLVLHWLYLLNKHRSLDQRWRAFLAKLLVTNWISCRTSSPPVSLHLKGALPTGALHWLIPGSQGSLFTSCSSPWSLPASELWRLLPTYKFATSRKSPTQHARNRVKSWVSSKADDVDRYSSFYLVWFYFIPVLLNAWKIYRNSLCCIGVCGGRHSGWIGQRGGEKKGWIYETDSQTERTDLWLPRGKGWGRDGLGVWD